MCPQGHTPIDLAHQVNSPLLVHMLGHVKQERIRSNSRCVRMLSTYRVRAANTTDTTNNTTTANSSTNICAKGERGGGEHSVDVVSVRALPGVPTVCVLRGALRQRGSHRRHGHGVLAAEGGAAGLCHRRGQPPVQVRGFPAGCIFKMHHSDDNGKCCMLMYTYKYLYLLVLLLIVAVEVS